MERRKILLGSGAALTTALAGCTGSGGDDGDDPDDDTESITDDGSEDTNDTENANDTEDTGDAGDGDPEESDGTDENAETDGDDVPGFDGSKLDLESDAVTIESIERTGDTIEVVATSEITDFEKLYAELGTLPDAHDSAIVDLEAFAADIESIDWVVDHEKKKVVSFSVETQWLVDYRNGDLSANAVLEKVKMTAE